MTERNPYAPPQAGVRDVPPPIAEAGALASRLARLVGAIADVIAYTVVMGPIVFFTGLWASAMSGEASYGLTFVAISALGLAVFGAINGYLLARRGQTVGKWLVGTRIVNASDGRRPTLATTLAARYGVPWLISLVPIVGNVFGLLDALFVFRRDRRCLHDLIAGTKVINVEPPASGD